MTTNHTLAERGERGEVTQADRDKARRWFEQWQGCAGERDALAYWFATHRIAARNAALDEMRPLIEELADDLEAQVSARYCFGGDGPLAGHERKYERDMIPVKAARAFLDTQPHTNKGD